MSDRLITIPATADELAVCTRTVRRLIERGDLAAVRVGRVVRVSRAALDDFIEKHTTAVSP